MNNLFLEFDIEEKKKIIEAMIFVADETLKIKDIVEVLNAHYIENEQESSKVGENDVREIVDAINLDLAKDKRPYKIVDYAGGYQFAVDNTYGQLVSRLIKTKSKKRLSQAALEALAVIAYNQPVSKPYIEEVRGVNSNEVVNSLIDKGFVKIAGRSEALGKPLLYGTTEDFLKHFGLHSLDELPPLKEIDDLTDTDFEHTGEEIVINIDNPDALKDLQESNLAISVETIEENDDNSIEHKEKEQKPVEPDFEDDDDFDFEDEE
jgi:segregation and condensation protein B